MLFFNVSHGINATHGKLKSEHVMASDLKLLTIKNMTNEYLKERE